MPFLIDGYNLLRAIQKLDEQFDVLDEAGLCRILSEYLKRKRSHAQVIFDGLGPPDKSDLSGFGKVEVYFSGQELEADDVIEDKILSNTAPKRLVVISTDRRIRAAAGKRKAISVRSELFFDEMEKTLERKIATPEPHEKRGGLTEAEAQQWIDFFDID